MDGVEEEGVSVVNPNKFDRRNLVDGEKNGNIACESEKEVKKEMKTEVKMKMKMRIKVKMKIRSLYRTWTAAVVTQSTITVAQIPSRIYHEGRGQ